MEYIDRHPPTHDTEYFNPVLMINGGSYLAITSGGPFDPKIQALLTVRPEATPAVSASMGKGWRKLEARAMPFRCGE